MGFFNLWQRICRSFSLASQQYFSSPKFPDVKPALVAITLMVSACSGGGGGGGDGGAVDSSGSGASSSNFVVSGTISAPGGAVAFLPRKNLLEQFADAFIAPVHAAISEFLSVAEGTKVELVRINNDGTVVSVLAATTTSSGRYSFDLTALGISAASDLVVQVLDSSNTPKMRAFVAAVKVDINPVSETAARIVLELAANSTLDNFTTQELADIYSALYLYVMTQDLPSGADIESTVSAFRNALLTDGNIAGFISATAEAGQTAQGPGDIGNYFPFEDGISWKYQVAVQIDGQPPINYNNTVQINGTHDTGSGVMATVFHETNPSNSGIAEDDYLVKDGRAITNYGSSDVTDFLAPQLVPYQEYLFPLRVGASFVAFNKRSLDLGEDWGNDGINEKVNINATVTVSEFEDVTVPAGSYVDCAKIIAVVTFVVTFSDDGSMYRQTSTVTEWYAPGIGAVKRMTTHQVPGTGYSETHTTELISFVRPPVLVYRQLDLPSKDLIYDPLRKVVYASVPGRAGALGNTITVIDPETGSIGPSVFIGSEPGKLAISDDGQYLYVALDGAAAVRRLVLTTMTPDIQFSLGSDWFAGPYYAEDIEVLPGAPQSVAVSRKYLGLSPRHAGVGIYDNGAVRATATPGHTGSNAIEFSATATRLYGYNNETTEYGFRRMTVNGAGVSTDDAVGSLISGFGVDIEFEGARVYSTSGLVIDPEERDLLGTYPLSTIYAGAAVRPDSANDLIFFLEYDFYGSSWQIETFNLSTFILLDSVAIPGISYTSAVGGLIRWGHNGLAFRSSDKVFLLDSPLIP
jgi:hypothetical protein